MREGESCAHTGNECAVGKSWRHARDHLLFTRTPTESCEFASAPKFGWATWDSMALTRGNLGLKDFRRLAIKKIFESEKDIELKLRTIGKSPL